MFDDLNKDSVKCNGLFLEIVCRFIDLQSAAALDYSHKLFSCVSYNTTNPKKKKISG